MQFMNFEKTVPFRKLGGALGFIQTVAVNITDMVVLNLLFVLTSLPIVTAGAALCALHSVCGKVARDEPIFACRDYFAAFMKYLRRDKTSGIVYLAVLLLGGFSFVSYFRWAHTYPLLYAAAALSLSGLLVVLLTAAVYFPCITQQTCTRSAALQFALKTSLVRLEHTAPAAAVSIIAFAAVAMLMPYGVILLLTLPFSLSALAACYATKGIIK